MSEQTGALRLDGKVAIVTGAGSGLGAAIARTFAAAGAAVVLGDLNGNAAQDMADGIRKAGAKARAVVADVSVADGFAALTEAALADFGGVDVIVNCAGYTQPFMAADKVGEDVFDRVFAVNVKSLYWCVKHVMPHLRKGSVIVNIASIGAVRPRPYLCWYNASKAAVETATKALAIELADRGIRVCAINPALADTPMTRELLAERGENAAEELARTIPLGRLCSPQDVADTALFLASDRASYLTGTCINVDGGRAI